MPNWTPDSRWTNSDAFIIGGGPSLSGFNWAKLHGRHTIGCNSAFKLGVNVCEVCFFSDVKWFRSFVAELVKFPGDVFTHSRRCDEYTEKLPWLNVAARHAEGLHHDAIGFGGNSGCSAVNLALLFGARRVFLLGFDCKLDPSKPTHWHNWKIEEPNPSAYRKFMRGWEAVARDLKKFPGREIINLGPDSAIPFFPKAEVSSVLP